MSLPVVADKRACEGVFSCDLVGFTDKAENGHLIDIDLVEHPE